MNTWNDHVQYQMLLDALNLNNNSLVSLSHEYYRSCFPVFNFYSYAAMGGVGGLPVADCDIFAADTANFLLGIPFAADSSHMEWLARTSTDINWSTSGYAQTNPLIGATCASVVYTGPANHCVFSAVCDWNLILRSSDVAVPNQCFSMQGVLNG
jgi:hypothetical protein